MSAPTAHQIRVASVKWAFEHSHVARHGPRAREFMARGADGISWEESKEHLIGIFEQLMLGIAYSDTDDEICELWHFMACLLYTSPSPRDLSTSRMPSSA